MKITIYTDSILETIMADAAMAAVLRRYESATPSSTLTPDHRHALRRLIVTAAAATFSAPDLVPLISALDLPVFPVAGELDDQPRNIEVHFRDTLLHDIAPEVLEAHLTTAVIAHTLSFLSLAYGDYRRSDRYLQAATTATTTLAAIPSRLSSLKTITSPSHITPSYF